ncbi:MAG: hypothetical protein GOMPHAMPRED_004436 [Gomphillus americanus]|uniref:Uncharacterized protein n=1 Tax=Gomphillus americanus TaxID=1940652 RepID=A0A8H3FTK6_9LECA|nr:MAG: hypothetical protein GOMPHAMPRED_004436 [Gomphillus americanus]
MASSSTPQIFGLPPFQFALITEAVGNIGLVFFLLFYPRTALGWILSNPDRDISLGADVTAQLIGALVVGLTVPLVMSIPSPNAYSTTQAADQQKGFRAATYVVLGSGEIALSLILGWKLFAAMKGEDVGLTQTTLWIAVGTMLSILPIRALFLYIRRDWLQECEQDSGGAAGKKEL